MQPLRGLKIPEVDAKPFNFLLVTSWNEETFTDLLAKDR